MNRSSPPPSKASSAVASPRRTAKAAEAGRQEEPSGVAVTSIKVWFYSFFDKSDHQPYKE